MLVQLIRTGFSRIIKAQNDYFSLITSEIFVVIISHRLRLYILSRFIFNQYCSFNLSQCFSLLPKCIINMQYMKKMFRLSSRKNRSIILVLCLINILGNTEIIGVKLASNQNSSINATSTSNSNLALKSQPQPNIAPLFYTVASTTAPPPLNPFVASANQFESNSVSKTSNTASNNQPIFNLNDAWLNYGNLTLQTLASNEFYANNGGNISSKQTNNNKSLTNNASTVSSTPQSAINNTSNLQYSNGNTMMNQNELKYFQNQLAQAQQKATNSVSNAITTKQTNAQPTTPSNQSTSIISNTAPFANLTNSAFNSFNFPSSPPSNANGVPSSNMMIENLRNEINSRFKSLMNP